MTLSIIIPAHNEEEQIAATVIGVLTHVQTPDREVIVVADHCSDGTETVVTEIAKSHAELRLIKNSDRPGSFSNALIAGIHAASGTLIVPVMADHCDDPSTIDRMVRAMNERNADVVCASRYMRGGKKVGGPWLQNIFSRIVCYSLRLFTGIPTWDCANSYKMYRSETLRALRYDIPNTGTEYSMALLFRAYFSGANIIEIPTTWTGTSIPINQEWKILRRFPNYWYWYRKALRWLGRKRE